MTPSDYIDDLLFALGSDALGGNAVILRIALWNLAEQITDAEFQNGLKLRDVSDVKQWLYDAADAAKQRAKQKATVSA
jgi:hypothetical protein